MRGETTRREFLEQIALAASALAFPGCAPKKKKTFVVSKEALEAISSGFPDFARAEEGSNKYITRMSYSDEGSIWFRKSESETRQLTRGVLPEWYSDSRVLFKRLKGVKKISFYDFDSEKTGLFPPLESFPIVSPDRKKVLQVIGRWIFHSKWGEGSEFYPFRLKGGSNPRWFNNDLVLYISSGEALKLCNLKGSSSEIFTFSELCRGFDISGDRKHMVYVETCPTKLSQATGLARGYTHLCLVDLEKVREKIRTRVVDIDAEELYVRDSTTSDWDLRQFLGPKISPNGKDIALVEGHGRNMEYMDIWVYNLETGERKIKSGLKREPNMPYERIVEWLKDGENLAVNHNPNKISVFNINTEKFHTFPGKNVSVYHGQEN